MTEAGETDQEAVGTGGCEAGEAGSEGQNGSCTDIEGAVEAEREGAGAAEGRKADVGKGVPKGRPRQEEGMGKPS